MPMKKDEAISAELRATLEKLQVRLSAAYRYIIEQAMSTGSLNQLKSKPEDIKKSESNNTSSFQKSGGDPAESL